MPCCSVKIHQILPWKNCIPAEALVHFFPRKIERIKRALRHVLSQRMNMCVYVPSQALRQHKYRCYKVYHYGDVMITTIASQITSFTVIYSTVYRDADQRKHQSNASLAFVWGIHRSRWIPRTKGQLRGKCLHLMTSSCKITVVHRHLYLRWCYHRLLIAFQVGITCTRTNASRAHLR